MADDLQAGGEDPTESAAEEVVTTWTATRSSPPVQDGEEVAATQWLEAVEEPSGSGSAEQSSADSAGETGRAAGSVLHATTTESRAVEAATTQAATEGGQRGRRRPSFLLLLGAIAVLALAGLVGWSLGRASTSSTETQGSETSLGSAGAAADAGGAVGVTEAAESTDPSNGSQSTDDAAAPSADSTTTSAASAETVESEPFVVPETPDNPSGATQYAVMADGQAVMRGWYPTEEQAQGAVADAAAIMGGTENVIDETQVDPGAEIRPDSFAVYLQDFILFEPDSAEITSEFYDFLAFPLVFMKNSPAATVTVVARTDASGSASYNLELATRRAEAVRDHWLANGGNAEQIILDPRGEEEADDDADDEQAALDRRVELRVSGFLAG
jgi:outer membrane protein OmpA-like peptidoglycan-associated protein